MNGGGRILDLRHTGNGGPRRRAHQLRGSRRRFHGHIHGVEEVRVGRTRVQRRIHVALDTGHLLENRRRQFVRPVHHDRQAPGGVPRKCNGIGRRGRRHDVGHLAVRIDHTVADTGRNKHHLVDLAIARDASLIVRKEPVPYPGIGRQRRHRERVRCSAEEKRPRRKRRSVAIIRLHRRVVARELIGDGSRRLGCHGHGQVRVRRECGRRGGGTGHVGNGVRHHGVQVLGVRAQIRVLVGGRLVACRQQHGRGRGGSHRRAVQVHKRKCAREGHLSRRRSDLRDADGRDGQGWRRQGDTLRTVALPRTVVGGDLIHIFRVDLETGVGEGGSRQARFQRDPVARDVQVRVDPGELQRDLRLRNGRGRHSEHRERRDGRGFGRPRIAFLVIRDDRVAIHRVGAHVGVHIRRVGHSRVQEDSVAYHIHRGKGPGIVQLHAQRGGRRRRGQIGHRGHLKTIYRVHEGCRVPRDSVLVRATHHGAVGQRITVGDQCVLIRLVWGQTRVLVRRRGSRSGGDQRNKGTVPVHVDKRIRTVHVEGDRGGVLVSHHGGREHRNIYQRVHVHDGRRAQDASQCRQHRVGVERVLVETRHGKRVVLVVGGIGGHRLHRRTGTVLDRERIVRALDIHRDSVHRNIDHGEAGHQ